MSIEPQAQGRLARKAKMEEIRRAVNALLRMEGRNGIRITASETNVIVDSSTLQQQIGERLLGVWTVSFVESGKVSISARSRLYNGKPLRTLRAISNYDPDNATPTELSISTANGNFIGIELTLNIFGAITAAEIVSSNLSGYVANTFYRLTGSAPIFVDRSFIPLAIMGDGAVAVQLARTHLRLEQHVFNGYLFWTGVTL